MWVRNPVTPSFISQSPSQTSYKRRWDVLTKRCCDRDTIVKEPTWSSRREVRLQIRLSFQHSGNISINDLTTTSLDQIGRKLRSLYSRDWGSVKQYCGRTIFGARKFGLNGIDAIEFSGELIAALARDGTTQKGRRKWHM